jgi:predicted negative regulator of RcsB-dependent stress response
VEHHSEEEQVEAIKQWIKENGSAVIVGIGIGIAGILGWQYWTNYQRSQAEQASLQFEAMTQAVAANDSAAVRRYGEQLLDEYGDSMYAMLGTLLLAKQAVEQGDNAAAAMHLQRVIDHSGQPQLVAIARLRLARVSLAENRLDDAQEILNRIDDPNLAAEVEELRGDVLLARQQPEAARSAYEAAKAARGAAGGSQMLDLKLNNLPALSVNN